MKKHEKARAPSLVLRCHMQPRALMVYSAICGGQAFGEIKNYYNDITHNNLDLIRSLKEEVRAAKKDGLTSRLTPPYHSPM